MADKYTKKIIKYSNDNMFIIFYNEWCGYSMRAIDLLKNKKQSFKGYKIDDMKKILYFLNESSNITNFNKKHKTRPMIFKNGKFIGGLKELNKYLN